MHSLPSLLTKNYQILRTGAPLGDPPDRHTRHLPHRAPQTHAGDTRCEAAPRWAVWSASHHRRPSPPSGTRAAKTLLHGPPGPTGASRSAVQPAPAPSPREGRAPRRVCPRTGRGAGRPRYRSLRAAVRPRGERDGPRERAPSGPYVAAGHSCGTILLPCCRWPTLRGSHRTWTTRKCIRIVGHTRGPFEPRCCRRLVSAGLRSVRSF